MQGLVKTLKVCSLSLCNFTWLRQTVSINLKLMGFLSIFLKQDTYPKLHQICLKPVEFTTPYVWFDKPKI